MPESEWDDEQRLLMLAFDTVEKLTGRYGEWLPEATSEDADPMNYKLRYVASAERVNQAEKAALDKMDALRKEKKDTGSMNGVFVTVERVDLASQ